MSGATRAYLYGLGTDDAWTPVRIDKSGALGGSAGPRSYAAWTYVAAAGGITDTSDVTLKAEPGVGNAVYLRALQIANKHATTGTEIVIKSGSTVLWRGYAGPVAAGAMGIEFPDPLVSDNNTALTAACVTTGTATLINAQGYVDVAYAQLQALVTPLEEIFADDGTLLLDDSGNTITLN